MKIWKSGNALKWQCFVILMAYEKAKSG